MRPEEERDHGEVALRRCDVKGRDARREVRVDGVHSQGPVGKEMRTVGGVDNRNEEEVRRSNNIYTLDDLYVSSMGRKEAVKYIAQGISLHTLKSGLHHETRARQLPPPT